MRSLEQNIGASDYSQHSLQPWILWEYIRNPWLCDIVKRILRTKEGENKILDYLKIKHILEYLKEQSFGLPNIASVSITPDEILSDRLVKILINNLLKDYNLTNDMKDLLFRIITPSTLWGTAQYYDRCITIVDRIIESLSNHE